MESASLVSVAAAASSPGIVPSLFIPLYAYPEWWLGPTYSWQTLANVAKANPSVNIVATINPNSGPGTSLNSDFTTGLATLAQASNIRVIGYTYSSYAARAISDVKSDIDDYIKWYPTVQGVMIDEMSNISGNESYYLQLTAYAKSKGMKLVMANPGTATISSYVGTVDMIQILESNGSLPNLSSIASLAFNGQYGPSNFVMGVYNTTLPSSSYIRSASRYIRWMYFTDQQLPNPYGVLPSYLSTEVAEFV